MVQPEDLRLLMLQYECRFQELLEEGLEPSVVTFNTLLKACMMAHDAKPASEVLEQLQQRGLKVNIATSYHTDLMHLPQAESCVSPGIAD